MSEAKFAEWVILELMGHRRLAGFLTEQEIGGASFLRLDIPGENGRQAATQLYSPQAVYCITPTTEELARAVAGENQPEPVHRWELRALKAPEPRIPTYEDVMDDDMDEYEDDEDDDVGDDEGETCGCRFCVCSNPSIAGESCQPCRSGAHQG